MSELSIIFEIIVEKFVELCKNHGIFVGILIFLGVFSIISAIGNKVFMAIKYLFMIFIAVPALLIFGLISKDNRKERLKELGEIRAYIKEKPNTWKRILYYGLFWLFIIFISVLFWIFLEKFIFPFQELNEYSKQVLANYLNYINGNIK